MVDPVLFVDDDEDLREVMEDILASLGIARVVTAASLRDVEAQRNDVLACKLAIVDINLGSDEPSGVDVYDWLQHVGFAGRIVFLTGHASNDPRVRQAANLAGSVIATKPLSVGELRTLLGAERQAI